MISRPYQYIFVSISMYNVSDQRRSLCHEEYFLPNVIPVIYIDNEILAYTGI